MGYSSYKHEHIESEILNLLNHTLKHEIYDEFIKKASFTAVKLNADNSVAYVYVDTFDRTLIAKLVTKLQLSKGVFKRSLAVNMNIRKIPDLKFLIDETIDNSSQIDKLLDKIRD
jgi:ribosome-binding factor A